MKLNTPPSIVVQRINDRIADEQTARCFYKSASVWCNINGFENFEKYFLDESQSENDHFDNLIKFMGDWNTMPAFRSVAAPETGFKSLEDILTQAYQMEYDLLKSYEKDAIDAMGVSIVGFNLFSGYVDIQNESVIEYAKLIDRLDNYKQLTNGMALFDAELK